MCVGVLQDQIRIQHGSGPSVTVHTNYSLSLLRETLRLSKHPFPGLPSPYPITSLLGTLPLPTPLTTPVTRNLGPGFLKTVDTPSLTPLSLSETPSPVFRPRAPGVLLFHDPVSTFGPTTIVPITTSLVCPVSHRRDHVLVPPRTHIALSLLDQLIHPCPWLL